MRTELVEGLRGREDETVLRSKPSLNPPLRPYSERPRSWSHGRSRLRGPHLSPSGLEQTFPSDRRYTVASFRPGTDDSAYPL